MSENAPPYEYSLVRGIFYLVDKKRILTISNFSQNRIFYVDQTPKISNLLEDLRKVEKFVESSMKTQKVVRKLEKVGRKAYLCKVKGYNYDQEGSIDSPD